MTNDDDTSNGNDPTDSTLDAAGQRMRQQGPDEIASREARRRTWWPALIGAGLATAAVIGVIAIRAGDTDTDTLTPVPTNPETEPQPTATSTPEQTSTLVPSTTGLGPTGASLVVDGGCITVTTAAGSATGCPQNDTDLDHLEQRTFVANLDGPVLINSSSSDPLVDLTASVDTGDFASRCRWSDLAPRIPESGLVEVVVCNDNGVMGLTTIPDAATDFAASYFTLPTPYNLAGTDLGLGTPLEGMPRALAFTAPIDEAGVCSILLLPDRTGWKESCQAFAGEGVGTALVQVSPADPTAREIALSPNLWQISVDDTGLIASATLLDAMAPSSGCSLDSATQLLQAVPESSIVTGIGCLEDTASLTTGSVLTQQGPPDGSIWLAQQDDLGVWNITDNGTGLDDESFAFAILPRSSWGPESTVPMPRPYWSEPIIAIPAQPTVEAFADELLAVLGPLNTDPEFPLDERIVAVRPAGLALIIAQVDIGGDDSVGGAVIYVWVGEVFDDSGPIGWQAGQVLVGDICARGDSAGQDLCI